MTILILLSPIDHYVATASTSENTITYHEFVTHVLPVINECFRGSVTGTGASTVPSLATSTLSPTITADMPLKTSRSTSSGDTQPGIGTGTGMGVGKGSSGSIQTDRQSEVLQALDGESDTVSDRGTAKSTYTGVSADSVTGGDSSNLRDSAASLPTQDSTFNCMPEYGVYDILIEGDEEIKDTYRNMMAVLPPPTV